jgi:hypothetical protein
MFDRRVTFVIDLKNIDEETETRDHISETEGETGERQQLLKRLPSEHRSAELRFM